MKPAAKMTNEIGELLHESAFKIRNRYDGLVARAKEDPGTSGDNGEEIWAGILRNWLPPIFDVRTKGRLITSSGEASPQIDVVVLSPFYPAALRDQTYFLLSGVVAAFECKNTLRSTHFEKFFENSRSLATMKSPVDGQPESEMCPPIVYGMLAHSHEWKRANSEPFGNIERALVKQFSLPELTSPRQLPSLLCVADVAARQRYTYGFKAKHDGQAGNAHTVVNFSFGVRSTFSSFQCGKSGGPPTQEYDSLNLFLCALYGELSSQFPQVLPIASDLIHQSVGDISGAFTYKAHRSFHDTCVSHLTRAKMEQAILAGQTEMLKTCIFPYN